MEQLLDVYEAIKYLLGRDLSTRVSWDLENIREELEKNVDNYHKQHEKLCEKYLIKVGRDSYQPDPKRPEDTSKFIKEKQDLLEIEVEFPDYKFNLSDVVDRVIKGDVFRVLKFMIDGKK